MLTQSTDYFVNSGYDAVFTGRLIYFYKQLATGEEDLDIAQMHKFLHEFYNNLERTPVERPSEAAARISLNQRRLIGTMTLLNLLRVGELCSLSLPVCHIYLYNFSYLSNFATIALLAPA